MCADTSRDPSPDESPTPEMEREDGAPPERERPLFQHPVWMVGVVVVLAMLSVSAGLDDPIWFLIGGPFILVAVVWVWVRLFAR